MTTRVRPVAASPAAENVGGAANPGGTDPARLAAFAALLTGLATLAGRWLHIRLRRRAHPPRHAYRATEQAPLMSRGQRRLPRGGDRWRW